MAAYATATQIAAYLGVTLTSPQQTQAGVMADAATAHVERATGRSWQVAAVTDELHEIVRGSVYLARAITAVSAVKVRSTDVDADLTTLTTDEWELLDAGNGIIRVSASDDALALVSYTPASTVPADIQLATTMIAAAWLGQALQPDTAGLSAVSVRQGDVSLKFSESRHDVPMAAAAILRGYTRLAFA